MHRIIAAAVAALVAITTPALAQTRWVMATAYPESNFHTQTIRAFLADIEAAAPGKLAVQLHPNASLMPLPQIKRGVQTGQIQLGEFLLGAYGNEDPIYEVDFLPFLVTGWDQGRALGQAIEPAIRARLERQGLTALYMVPWPSQGLYTGTELRSAEDLKGARFRAQTPVIARMAELLQATPVLVQAADIPQAFATGIINAMVTSAQTGVDSAAWDYSKYFYNIGFTLTRNVVVANTRALKALDAPTQAAIMAAAERATTRGWEASEASEKVMTARLQAQGMNTPAPSEALMTQLRAIGARQEAEWVQKAGPEGKAMLDRYRALLQ
jgi:TRAP-type C4-dicarboxylate transport system substrate-binding protein